MENNVKKKLNQLFNLRKNKKEQKSKEVSTIPLKDFKVEQYSVKGKHIEPQQLLYCCSQSVGKQREHNEDSIFSLGFITVLFFILFQLPDLFSSF